MQDYGRMYILRSYKKLFWFGLAVIAPLIFFGCQNTGETSDILRLHIRANSNSRQDQAVKLAVRGAVLEYISRELTGIQTVETAKGELRLRLNTIEEIADGVLKREGFSYRSSASVAHTFFPRRVYQNFTLRSGYYDALVISLGQGGGGNWWCVIYPPLCYFETGGESEFFYRSWLAELFQGCG